MRSRAAGPTAGRRPGRTRPCWCRRAYRPRESGAVSWRHYTPADYTFLTAISTRRARRLTIGRQGKRGFRTDAGVGGRGQRRSRRPRDESVGPGRPRRRRSADRRRCRGLVAHGAIRRRGARSRPARCRRAHPARPDASAAQPDAGPHPVGARRARRPGRRPQQGRQRLHGEAVLDGRAHRPPAGPAAPLARPRRPDADFGQRRAQDRWPPGRRRRPDAELPAREVDVLEVLLKRSGKVVSTIRCRARSSARRRTSPPTRSRSMSIACARSWPKQAPTCRSTRSAAPAT